MTRCLLAVLVAFEAAYSIDFSPLEQIAIQEGGRKKPLLIFAEETLLGLSGKTALTTDGRKMGALEVVTTIWLNPQGWETKPLLLVNHQPLKQACGLDPAKRLFSYQELASNKELAKLLKEAQALRTRPGSQTLTGLPKHAAEVGLRLAEFESLLNGSAFRLVPNPQATDAQWSSLPGTSEVLRPLREALQANDDVRFHKEAEALHVALSAKEPQFQPPGWKIQLEILYQKAHPFRWAWIAYAAAGIVLLVPNSGVIGYAAGWVLAGAGFLLQIAGFAARVTIAGRPPVTNMYESVIWVAFGTILFALVFEAIYRGRYFLLAAVPVAVSSLILADTQTLSLDRSINPIVPVLRDNFWLTTHVLTITLSYAAFALALGIGHMALLRVIRGINTRDALYNYLYRTLQVGVLLLATGTILGGVWANYSWGRFWDWDPKETWALITLLGYLIVLHGRIAGKWADFGMAVGSVLAFQGVLMAWYGVNFVLGVGLHSYGFGTGGLGWALVFVAAELGFVLLAWVCKARHTLRSSSSSVTSKPELVS